MMLIDFGIKICFALTTALCTVEFIREVVRGIRVDSEATWFNAVIYLAAAIIIGTITVKLWAEDEFVKRLVATITSSQTPSEKRKSVR